ncbi:MAG: hypothetical protein DDT21_02235 [Syntrophomonadaceae bacterium]|nr:hypothetical protein [Bacillota bacterium]
MSDYAGLVERAIAKKNQLQEQQRLRLLASAMQALDKLAAKVSFTEAFIFGSAAKPFGFNEQSDLDIGFYGLRDQDYFAAMAFLSRETGLDNVDIIQLEGHRLADKILKEGIPWKKNA